MHGVTILGSTGSIGVQTLEVIAANADQFQVVALGAGRRADELLQQCLRLNPKWAVLADTDAAASLQQALREHGCGTEVLAGADALCRIATTPEAQTVVAGIVGAAGLLPTLAAVDAGKRVLLANKEALVMAGELMLARAREGGARLLPVDSEHNAIFQCLPAGFERGLAGVGVEEIILTASGGPFRDTPIQELKHVTPAQACNHPNWEMGRKISVDSATMMNKGLEVIEARWLFEAGSEHLSVLMHRASVVHSMVRFRDGSVLAQMGNPDMRTPIAHALAWPERIDSGVAALDLVAAGPLTFEPVDVARFPCVNLAYQALARGDTAPAVLNAANEMAVTAFLDGKLRFDRIHEIIESALVNATIAPADNIDTVLSADAEARSLAADAIRQLTEVSTA